MTTQMIFCDVFFFEKEPHLDAVEVSSITHNTVPHINSETNPSPPQYQCCLQVSETVLDTSFGVVTLPICYNIE